MGIITVGLCEATLSPADGRSVVGAIPYCRVVKRYSICKDGSGEDQHTQLKVTVCKIAGRVRCRA